MHVAAFWSSIPSHALTGRAFVRRRLGHEVGCSTAACSALHTRVQTFSATWASQKLMTVAAAPKGNLRGTLEQAGACIAGAGCTSESLWIHIPCQMIGDYLCRRQEGPITF